MAVYQVNIGNVLGSISSILTDAGAATVLYSDASYLIVQPAAAIFDRPIRFYLSAGVLCIQTGDSWSSGNALSGTVKQLAGVTGYYTPVMQSASLVISSSVIAIVQHNGGLYNWYSTTVLTKTGDGGICWIIANMPSSPYTVAGYVGKPIFWTSNWDQGDVMRFLTGPGALASANGFYLMQDIILRSPVGVFKASPAGIKVLLQAPTGASAQITPIGNDVILQTGGSKSDTGYFIWNLIMIGGAA
jgi:hypothetical protein